MTGVQPPQPRTTTFCICNAPNVRCGALAPDSADSAGSPRSIGSARDGVGRLGMTRRAPNTRRRQANGLDYRLVAIGTKCVGRAGSNSGCDSTERYPDQTARAGTRVERTGNEARALTPWTTRPTRRRPTGVMITLPQMLRMPPLRLEGTRSCGTSGQGVELDARHGEGLHPAHASRSRGSDTARRRMMHHVELRWHPTDLPIPEICRQDIDPCRHGRTRCRHSVASSRLAVRRSSRTPSCSTVRLGS